MIGGCFLSAGYAFYADVYTKRRTVDDATGEIGYKWQLWKTVDCLVSPFTSTSFKAQGTTETFGDVYEKKSYLKMLTKENIGRNVQVTNIRQKSTDELVYYEVELRAGPATWYNSSGSSPVLDPFGRIIEWDTLIHRADEQGEKANV
jgi:hypothetical protein